MVTGTANCVRNVERMRHKPENFFTELWFELCSKFSNNTALNQELYDDLLHHYDAGDRYYHNSGHITSMLLFARQYSTRISEPVVLGFSIYFHDVIYHPGSKDNEVKSASYAQEVLKKLGVPEEQSGRICNYIIATRNHHQAKADDKDLQYFLDFDLSILAADRVEYMHYAHAIRKEFTAIPDIIYNMGRQSFLKSLLNLPHQFYTDDFRKHAEKARNNLTWEITMLEHS